LKEILVGADMTCLEESLKCLKQCQINIQPANKKYSNDQKDTQKGRLDTKTF